MTQISSCQNNYWYVHIHNCSCALDVILAYKSKLVFPLSHFAVSTHPGSRSAFATNTVQQLLELADSASPDPSQGGYHQTFAVTYLGSMEVAASQGN